MPFSVRPLVSKLKVATIGRPVVRPPAMAASVSSTDDMVSIQRMSAPPRASAVACSAKASRAASRLRGPSGSRSEEHTSELQSHLNLVCRLLLEKKKTFDDNKLCDLIA